LASIGFTGGATGRSTRSSSLARGDKATALASLLLAAGTIGDLRGHKRVVLSARQRGNTLGQMSLCGRTEHWPS
jgi:hypothetical protein